MTYRPRPPCEVCRRCHRGPRCKPAAARTVRLTVSIPADIDARLRARAPWGDRSAWVAQALADQLDR